jgi:hypothetical protein
LLIAILALAMGCRKPALDLDSGQYFGIRTVLTSKNCHAACDETADCEGRNIRVRGKLDPRNINASDSQFFLLDEERENFHLEVRIDSAIQSEVFRKLEGKGGAVLRVEGTINGFSAPTNLNCKRRFWLRVRDASKVGVR